MPAGGDGHGCGRSVRGGRSVGGGGGVGPGRAVLWALPPAPEPPVRPGDPTGSPLRDPCPSTVLRCRPCPGPKVSQPFTAAFVGCWAPDARLGAAAPAPSRLPSLGAPVLRPPAGSGVLGRSCAPGLAPALFTPRSRVAGAEAAEYGGTGARVVGVYRGRGCSCPRGEVAAALPVLHTLLSGGCAQSRPAAGTVVVL